MSAFNSFRLAFSCWRSKALLSSSTVMYPSQFASICLNKSPNSWICFSGIWEAINETDKVFSLENLENSFSFLKSSWSGTVLALPDFIQGWSKIWFNDNLFSFGTRIFLIKSLSSELKPIAYSVLSENCIFLTFYMICLSSSPSNGGAAVANMYSNTPADHMSHL